MNYLLIALTFALISHPVMAGDPLTPEGEYKRPPTSKSKPTPSDVDEFLQDGYGLRPSPAKMDAAVEQFIKYGKLVDTPRTSKPTLDEVMEQFLKEGSAPTETSPKAPSSILELEMAQERLSNVPETEITSVIDAKPIRVTSIKSIKIVEQHFDAKKPENRSVVLEFKGTYQGPNPKPGSTLRFGVMADLTKLELAHSLKGHNEISHTLRFHPIYDTRETLDIDQDFITDADEQEHPFTARYRIKSIFVRGTVEYRLSVIRKVDEPIRHLQRDTAVLTLDAEEGWTFQHLKGTVHADEK